ncbi:MAG TPA: pyridoxal phosphate-dependent aminotransferase [Pseudonocardiaceae bacterium]
MTHSTVHRPHVSSRAAVLSGNSLGDLFLLARARGAIDLAVGTPGYPEPSGEMLDEATRAMRAGRNQYDHPAGDLLLRQRIAETLNSPTDPATELTVTVGATEALCVALLACVDPGDEVVLFSPGYEQFTGAVRLAGAIPRYVPMRGPEWHYDHADLVAAFTPRTRAVLLNTPSNPTGRVLLRSELESIAEVCRRWDVTVISDEVYRDFVFDGRRHVSATEVPGLAERCVVVGSLSKSHAVSGWRLGFLRAAPERTEVLRRVHEVTTNGASVPLQVAAGLAALSIDLAEASTEMARRRDLAQDIFGRMGMAFAEVQGGCFLFADIGPLTEGRQDSTAFVHQLLDRAGVLVVPGDPFFSDPADGRRYVRIAFNRRTDVLREVERRIQGP